MAATQVRRLPPVLSACHDNPEMVPGRDWPLRRLRARDVRRAAFAEVFPGEGAPAAGRCELPQAQEIVLDTPDGEKIVVWHIPPRDGRPVVLYMHGNGGSVFIRAERFRAITAEGNGLVALSYRGYGGSTGRPTEAGLIADETAYQFAVSRYTPQRIVVWGESLGTGVATTLASEYPVGALLLESPFTSAADVGATVYWFLPVRLLMKDQFRSDERIGKVTAPVLIIHGAKDRVVPMVLGERLFALANEPKQFRVSRGAATSISTATAPWNGRRRSSVRERSMQTMACRLQRVIPGRCEAASPESSMKRFRPGLIPARAFPRPMTR